MPLGTSCLGLADRLNASQERQNNYLKNFNSINIIIHTYVHVLESIILFQEILNSETRYIEQLYYTNLSVGTSSSTFSCPVNPLVPATVEIGGRSWRERKEDVDSGGGLAEKDRILQFGHATETDTTKSK